ncbi:MAG: polyphosphate polymerase domain-containing protein [Clostridia bacterium]|nr:polyphosphate polymerase domain-containing protein [Clostridia bacterium]
MKFRHEMKIEISKADFFELRMRLGAVMKRDENGENGKYEIRSLYFDTADDRALMEKIDGVNKREKYRIRLYNRNADFIKLEVKRKIAGLTNKESCVIDRKRVQAILDGDTAWMPLHETELIRNLYDKMKYESFWPKTIVEYTREAFLYDAGNVRVTLDYDIRTGMQVKDFLKSDAITVPVWDDRILLEVKWDEFLPDIVRDAVRIDGRGAGAFSKYAQARIYG